MHPDLTVEFAHFLMPGTHQTSMYAQNIGTTKYRKGPQRKQSLVVSEMCPLCGRLRYLVLTAKYSC